MAIFTSTVSFDLRKLDWNEIIRETSTTAFNNNRSFDTERVAFNLTFPTQKFSFAQGKHTVEDTFFMWWDPDNVTFLGGDGIRMGPDAPKAGSLTFFQTQYNETTKVGQNLSFFGFNVDITDFVSAALTTDTADDATLFAKMMSGRDMVTLSKGRDYIKTGAKADYINGAGGSDTLFGEAGDDLIVGEKGHDRLFGGKGNDVLIGGTGNDVIDGGDGIDTVVFGDGVKLKVELLAFGRQKTGEGNDLLINIENVVGGNRGDILRGNFVNNRIYGGDGNDTIDGFDGNDVLDGGAGRDAVYGGDGNDKLFGRDGDDYLAAGFGKDKLFGGDGEDDLEGSDGNDVLNGGAGKDELFGDAGKDVLIGGDDADRFSFRKADGINRIRDFEDGVDIIRILEGAKRFNQLTIKNSGDDVSIKFAATEIIVENTEPGELTKADFLFG